MGGFVFKEVEMRIEKQETRKVKYYLFLFPVSYFPDSKKLTFPPFPPTSLPLVTSN